jgi:hypothetical protein
LGAKQGTLERLCARILKALGYIVVIFALMRLIADAAVAALNV